MTTAPSGDPVAVLAAAVPPHVRRVCATLAEAGHEAVTVGGAVRDALLGREPGDWDVATSARPEQVLALFAHCIPTGLQHGTVTVVTGRGEASHVEVTTFRGEGTYSDGRRPDTVQFGVALRDDLARRDLVVNAMAFDPAHRLLHDPFGGLADLAARRLRAVGPTGDAFVDAVARFTEDGLRAMRVVRFAAVLEFDVDADTARGIAQPSVLASLAKVSRERVADELRKLLAAPRPSRGLRIAEAVGIVASILPAVAAVIVDVAAWLARVDDAVPEARLAALLADLGRPGPRVERAVERDVEAILRALKLSSGEVAATARLVAVAKPALVGDDPALRRLLADVARPLAASAVSLWRASGELAIADRAAAILARGDALATADLAVGGKQLIEALALAPGPAVGALLARLLDRVLVEPSLNTRDGLLAEARVHVDATKTS
jgi:tRNA nucleotidyltransferase (CCA-adding enzyme)